MAPPAKKRPPRTLIEIARRRQDALEAAGLSPDVLDRYEAALRALDPGPLGTLAQVLVRDIRREVAEIQAAVRKEFPADPDRQAAFRAEEPLADEPREVLALGRLIAREASGSAQRLIKYGINAATLKHLTALGDQLDKELGGADPAGDARALEEQILAAARRAFAGTPELSLFPR